MNLCILPVFGVDRKKRDRVSFTFCDIHSRSPRFETCQGDRVGGFRSALHPEHTFWSLSPVVCFDTRFSVKDRDAKDIKKVKSENNDN